MDKNNDFLEPEQRPPTSKKHFFARPVVVFICLILFFPLGLYLMYYHKVYTPRTRLILTIIFLLIFIPFYFVDPQKDELVETNTELKDQNFVLEQRLQSALKEKDELLRDSQDLEKENSLLSEQVALASPYLEDLEKKEAQKKKDEQAAKAKKAKEAEAKQIAEAKKKEAEAKAKKEAEAKAQAEAEAKAEADKKAAEEAAAAEQQQEQQEQEQAVTTDFQNCTDLRGTYPDGVPSDHPAYQPKMDRDNDNWACEN